MKKLLILTFALCASSLSHAQTLTCDTATIFANELSNAVCIELVNNVRYIFANQYPDHSDNYNQPFFTVTAGDYSYSMCAYPDTSSAFTPLYEETESTGCTYTYTFGVSINGVTYDPNSAVTYAELDAMGDVTGEDNHDWHLEATSTLGTIGQNMGTENAGHINPSGEYHYHGAPSDYFTDSLGITSSGHSSIVGYAADGFPIYYKYVYSDAMDSLSGISGLSSGYSLKSGSRPGDSTDVPGGVYDGLYYEDYEYNTTDLDECNGRYGITPDFPEGTYYYVLTDNYPYIPRCFKGTVLDNTFRVGPDAACPVSTASTDCSSEGLGCLDPFAKNYDASATVDDGSCVYEAPGDVADGLDLWLKADAEVVGLSADATDGDAVYTWQDQSGNRTNDAIQLYPPTFRDNSTDYINYHPVVEFDGTDDGLSLEGDYIYSDGTGDEDGMTWFAIVKPNSESSSKEGQYLFDFGNYDASGYGFAYGSENTRLHTPTNDGGANTGTLTHTNGTNPTLASIKIDFGNNQRIFFNGSDDVFDNSSISLTALSENEISESSSADAGNGPFTIGRQCKNGGITNEDGRYLSGSIAELIGYNKVLSVSEIRRVESYLAIKYGLTLGNSGGGNNGNYLTSYGSIIWDASASTAYHNDIIAIGRDDEQGLNQKQSKTTDDSTKIYLTTLATSNAGSSDSFASDSAYIIIGHETSELYATTAANSEVPGGVTSRLAREWQVGNENYSSTFSVDIQLSADANIGSITTSDLRLLIDDDGDFSDASSFATGGGLTISHSGGLVTVSGISNTHIPADATRYLSIGSASSSTPLASSSSTTWTGTWSNGMPDTGKDAIISADYNSNTEGVFEANNLTVNGGFALTIEGDSSISIDGNLVNSGSVIIKDTSAFVQTISSPSNSGTGAYTVEREGADYHGIYNYWSSPVQNTTINETFSSNGKSFYTFDASTQTWAGAGKDAILSAGVGFTATGTSSSATTVIRSFSDSIGFNSGDIALSVNYNGVAHPDSNFNLIGNPYPSGLDVNQFLTDNSAVLTNSIYLWSSDGSDYTSANSDYATMGLAGTVGAGGSGIDPSSATVASAQGFFAQTDGFGNVQFSNSQRITTNNTFQKTNCSTCEHKKIWLGVESENQASNELLVAFMEDADDGDDKYDARKLSANSFVSLYSIGDFAKSEEKLAIQGLPLFTDGAIIPIGIEAKEAGTFTFDINHLEGFGELDKIYLHDNIEDELIDLRNGDYKVALDKGGFNDRFSLRFIEGKVTGIESQLKVMGLSLFTTKDEIHLQFTNGALAHSEIGIYDISGKLIRRVQNEIETTVVISMAQKGIYIVKVANENGVVSKKLFVE